MVGRSAFGANAIYDDILVSTVWSVLGVETITHIACRTKIVFQKVV